MKRNDPSSDEKRADRRRMGFALLLALLVHGALLAGLYFWESPASYGPAVRWNPEWDSPLDAANALDKAQQKQPFWDWLWDWLDDPLAMLCVVVLCAAIACPFLIGVFFLVFGGLAALCETVWAIIQAAKRLAVRTSRCTPPVAGPVADDHPAFKEAMTVAKPILDSFRAGHLPPALPRDLIRDSDGDLRRFIDSLPGIEVARYWGIAVKAYNGATSNPEGQYSGDGQIKLGVKNLSTWAHELIHAADHRTGLIMGHRQQLDDEVVAVLGGTILLEALDRRQDADRGGALQYIQACCTKENVPDPVSACCALLNRTCRAVALVLATGNSLAAAREVKNAEAAKRVAHRGKRVRQVACAAGVGALAVVWAWFVFCMFSP